MIEREIQKLDAGGADRSLDRLEADVWARLDEHGRAKAGRARLMVIEGILIALAFGVSAATGCYCGYRAHRAAELSVLSLRAPLTASTLLDGGRP